MKKRLCAVLAAAVLLLTAIPVSGLSEQERFSNAQDLMSYLFYDCTYMLVDEIELTYTQALDDFFDGGFDSDILANCGIIHKGVSWDQKRRRMTISDIEYYPGYKAAQAWEMGITDILNEDERTLLARAEAMVEEARMHAQSPYQVLVNLHDALVKRTVYTPGGKDRTEWNYRDTAIGALVYGEADCDGYADAFYLLGTLAGFQVRTIGGDAINENGEYGGHTWNLIWWEDGWYHVDVTWDDVDFPEDAAMVSYQYLLAGSSMLTKHLWKEEYLVSQPQKYTNWDQYYYTCDKSGMAYGAYYNTLEDAANYAVYMQRNYYDRNMIHVMIDGDYEEQTDRVIDQLLKSGMNGMFYTWVRESGGYSVISIYK